MDLSRRRFVSLASGLLVPAAMVGGLAAPRLAAAPLSSERKFLFVFVRGGWDTSYVFTSMLGNPYVTPEGGAVDAVAGGIPFVDNGNRPSVRSFFEAYGDQVCVINGFEVRSVTHERCRRILMTGSSETGTDDWPSALAAASSADLLCPYLVIAGPAFTAEYTSEVVRVGDEGQLPELLDGSALGRSTLPVSPPEPALQDLEDAFVQARVAQAAAAAGSGRAARFNGLYEGVLGQLDALRGLSGQLVLDPEDGGCSRNLTADAATALDCLEMGITRCAMIQHNGWCDSSWDTHEDNSFQAIHYEELFAYLIEIMADLEGRTGAGGGPLADEVTVVVFSEMGRHPQTNSWGGKDHWTYTSAMLWGAGVRGGQVLGGLDENGRGLPIDLASGESTDSGEALLSSHIGATLFALGDVDPGEHTAAPPIAAVLS